MATYISFALAALAVMAAVHLVTAPIASLPLLLVSRMALAAVLYYAVMRVAGARILMECQRYILSKIHKQ